MADDLSQRHAISGLIRKHDGHHVNKFFREESWLMCLLVSFPEQVLPIAMEKSVKRITWGCLIERWVSCVHDEQDYTNSKQIDFLTLVRWRMRHLGCLVALGAHSSLQTALSIASFHGCCKTEINDPQIVILVNKDIFRLEIAMANTFHVAGMQGHEQLLQVKAAQWSRKRALGYKVKEFAF